MGLNSVRHAPIGYEVPDLAEPCGPGELATAVLSIIDFKRSTGFDVGLPPLSDGGLRRLMDLVYYTSQAPEEGRFPRLSRQLELLGFGGGDSDG